MQTTWQGLLRRILHLMVYLVRRGCGDILMTSFIIYDKFLVTERWQCRNCYQRSLLTCNIFWLLVVTKYGKRYRCGKPSRRGPGKRTILNNLQVNLRL